MSGGKNKMALALLIGLVATVGVVLGLFTSHTQAVEKVGDEGHISDWPSNLIWPLSGSATPDTSFSSSFGPRLKASEGFRYDFHRGLDIYTVTNTLIYAVTNGQVRIAGTHAAYQSTVVQLCHPNCASPKFYSNYLHIVTSTIPVTNDQMVAQGELIAYSGTSENENRFPHLHFEIRNGSVYQRDTVNPFQYLPYDDGLNHSVAISGVYLHPAGSGNTTATVRAIVTSPRSELDFNAITLTVNSTARTEQRTVDFQALNQEMTTLENPAILDDPYIHDVCIMPARFNTTTAQYRIDFVFYGLRGSNGVTLISEASDVHANVVSATTGQTMGDFSISPNYSESRISPGMTGTIVHTLTNTSSDPQTWNLRVDSAQGKERWSVKVVPKSITLESGSSETVTVTASVSPNVSIGTVNCIALTAVAGDDAQAIALDVVVVVDHTYLPVTMKNFPTPTPTPPP